MVLNAACRLLTGAVRLLLNHNQLPNLHLLPLTKRHDPIKHLIILQTMPQSLGHEQFTIRQVLIDGLSIRQGANPIVLIVDDQSGDFDGSGKSLDGEIVHRTLKLPLEIAIQAANTPIRQPQDPLEVGNDRRKI